ncbi:MAG: T9SS type A sorting domain-containing protein [Flavobacteriales bacterium]|nr:T9SS type A sorting domain-containing protein [Flavobacteriales bacterium]
MLQKGLRYSFLIIFVIFRNDGNSQNFEWLKTFGGSSQDFLSGVCAEPKGGCVALSYTNGKNFSVKYDSITITCDSTSMVCILRLDSSGKVIHAKKIADNTLKQTLARDLHGNFIIGFTLLSSGFIATKFFDISKGRIVIAKLDRNFNLIWNLQIGNGINSSLNYFTVSNEKYYFISSQWDSSKIGANTYFSQYIYHVFGEIDTSSGSIKWSKCPAKDFTDEFRLSSILNIGGQLYLSGDFDNRRNKINPIGIQIGKDTIVGPGGFILQTDTFGNYVKNYNFSNQKHLEVNCLASDNEYLYIGGAFIDSINFGHQKVGSEYKSYDLRETDMFVASLDFDLKPRWFFHPKTIAKGRFNSLQGLTTSDGYVYCGSNFSGRIALNGREYYFPIGNLDALIFKLDYLGNVLWATNGGDTLSNNTSNIFALNALANQSVFVGGQFVGKIKVGKFQKSSNGNFDFWLTRLSDFSITRNKVLSGPYCAGDTILIPFTKLGNFDTSNIFIAQLSDENGDFNLTFSELGRTKSNQAGTIIGKLPSVQLNTSSNYRIRIISTNPYVQSYYLRDSLRLLIYSRDKADPGPTETICKGDSIRIHTYGGTKWFWSPMLNMDDSSKRDPLVWPLETQTYQIIIGDSSGCGAPDTAYKTITVRPPLKSNLAFTDSSVCEGSISLPVHFTGGDSSFYHWQWHYIASNKVWFKLKHGKLSTRDTFEYTPTVPIERFAIILSDSCTNNQDTTYFNLGIRTPVLLNKGFRDTIVCNGNVLWLIAKANGGLSKNYHWQWKDIFDQSILSKSDTLLFTQNKNTKIELTVNDGCVEFGDTQIFNIYVHPKLTTSIQSRSGALSDTMLCLKDEMNLVAKVSGGGIMGYSYQWFLDHVLIGDSSYLNFEVASHFPKSGGTKILKLFVDDGCTANPDTIVKKVTVLENPVANFSVVGTCNLKPIAFEFTGSFPSPSVNPKYQWYFDNIDSSDQKDPFYKFTSSGTKKVFLKITADNGCKNTVSRNIIVKPHAKADFKADDVCEDSSVIFINHTLLSDGIVNYIWYFGDGNSSNIESPLHQYLINGVTLTYNVKMVANVKDGCSDSIIKAVTVHAFPEKGFSYTTSGQNVSFKANENNGDLYVWDFGDGGTESTNKPDQSYSYTKFPSGKYKACLKVTNLAGCISDTCIEILISGLVQSFVVGNKIRLYPNPNTGKFNIEISEPDSEMKLEIINSLGQTIYSGFMSNLTNTFDLILNPGIYHVRIALDNYSYGKIMIVSN